MKRSAFPVLFFFSAVLSGPALGAPELRPGLWEHSFKMESTSGELEAALEQARKMLESLPPEQRRMIESQMANQGISFDLENYTAKACITAEQAARREFPQPSENCQQTLEQDGDVYKVQFHCEDNPPTSGKGELRLVSEREYQGEVTLNTTVNGQAEQLVASQHGSWLADDCGSVRPIGE
ncbi:DUF3617 domain-containing protein [Gilvimarinus sp. F26214L]|uniref:DUF3617 domain-containing protein n=1 Tax=Gilvimarinus sp. DZF01 TaxID=3461371 RepID=UPI004045E6CE